MPDLLNTLTGLQGIGGQVSNLLNSNTPGSVSPYMKSPSLAANVFGLTGETFIDNVPFLGFQYFVKINYNGQEAENYLKTIYGGDLKSYEGVMPLIKNISMPSVGVDTDILNQYNRHRINQQRLSFEPAKITFHDVVGGKTMKLWKAYYNYYFATGQNQTTEKLFGDNFITDNTTGQNTFGYNIQTVGSLKYLFKSIDIYQVQGKRVNKTTLYNPRISSFDHDTLSYESSTPVELTMTFEYEWINYETDITSSLITDDEVTRFFSAELSNSFEMRAFKNLASKLDLSTRISGGAQVARDAGPPQPGVAAANKQTPLDTLRRIKKEAQGIVGRAASASALFNQIQIDVLGVDKPIIKAPNIRDFSAAINTFPTAYPDVRRVVRNLGN